MGRARFELATNGLKDLRIVLNSNQNISLNLPRKCCGIGGWRYGIDWYEVDVEWFRQYLVGASGEVTVVCRVNRQNKVDGCFDYSFSPSKLRV